MLENVSWGEKECYAFRHLWDSLQYVICFIRGMTICHTDSLVLRNILRIKDLYLSWLCKYLNKKSYLKPQYVDFHFTHFFLGNRMVILIVVQWGLFGNMECIQSSCNLYYFWQKRWLSINYSCFNSTNIWIPLLVGNSLSGSWSSYSERLLSVFLYNITVMYYL